jgi:4-hydroxy-3-polyprenylbenzoate decarboxylase
MAMAEVVLVKERVVLGITGASGSIYAELMLRSLLAAGVRTYLVATDTARKVIATELPENCLIAQVLASGLQARLETNSAVAAAAESLGLTAENIAQLRVFSNDDFYAPIASGSEGATHMVVAPCSMGTMARIAHGMSTCLLERCADVMLKEKRTLVISPRETPLSTIHLQNMLTLAQAGAVLVPAMPAFYSRPQSVEEVALFVVERLLDQLRLTTPLRQKSVRWNIRRL